MAAILAAIFGEKIDEKLLLNAKVPTIPLKVPCAKFCYKRADGLGGDSERADRRTDETKSMPPPPHLQ